MKAKGEPSLPGEGDRKSSRNATSVGSQLDPFRVILKCSRVDSRL